MAYANCQVCHGTSWIWEDEPEAGGLVESPCPNCGNGQMPEEVAETHDAAADAEIEAAWQWHDRRERDD